MKATVPRAPDRDPADDPGGVIPPPKSGGADWLFDWPPPLPPLVSLRAELTGIRYWLPEGEFGLT